MSCRYKDECPSYSGWCKGPKQDFSRCVEFLITAYENEKQRNEGNLRPCKVINERSRNVEKEKTIINSQKLQLLL